MRVGAKASTPWLRQHFGRYSEGAISSEPEGVVRRGGEGRHASIPLPSHPRAEPTRGSSAGVLGSPAPALSPPRLREGRGCVPAKSRPYLAGRDCSPRSPPPTAWLPCSVAREFAFHPRLVALQSQPLRDAECGEGEPGRSAAFCIRGQSHRRSPAQGARPGFRANHRGDETSKDAWDAKQAPLMRYERRGEEALRLLDGL